MKVLPINRLNFKGELIDTSKDGIWSVKYRPYSWEKPDDFFINNSKSFSLTDTKLPDNEWMLGKTEGPRVYKTDILGTALDYQERLCSDTRTVVPVNEVGPSMNLEESLIVLEKKLRAFLGLKEKAMLDLKKEISETRSEFPKISHKHWIFASDIDRPWGRHEYRKSSRKEKVNQYFREMHFSAVDITEKFELYAKFAESQKPIWQKISWIKTQLQAIRDAKATDSLIDISRRDVENPNGPLKEALGCIENARGKLVALPEKTIPVADIIKAIGKDITIENAIKFVETIMKKK